MSSIDERIVSMAFENAKFEAGVAQTMASLAKLNASLATLGSANGLAAIEAAANKINFVNAAMAADALKAKMDFSGAVKGLGDVQGAASKINLGGAGQAADGLRGKFQSASEGIKRAIDGIKNNFVFSGATRAFGAISDAANRVNFGGITRAIENIKGRFNFGSAPQRAFADVESASNGVRFTGIQNAVSEVGKSFGLLQGVASVAFGNIASQAIQKGATLAKALTIDPISSGLKEYETNLNSVQTIMANTQSEGTKLKDVNAALQELNVYSDKTIYNFSEMAKNIGTFTAAGVKLKTATESIKGIANLAALSGSSSQQASTAMYQLSQAIAAGKVNLQDWNSVQNAGLGGKVFQKALFDTAVQMGTIKNVKLGTTFEEWQKQGNNFRTSLSAAQKEAKDGTKALADAQKESAKSVKDAEESAAEAVKNAAQAITDAQKGVADANKRAAEDSKAAAEAVVSAQQAASEAIQAAKDKVKEAQKNVSDAAKQGALDIKAAIQSQRDSVKNSAENIKSALDGVTEARKRLVEAMKPVNPDKLAAASDALETAQLDQKDLATAVTDAQTEQKRAAEDLAAAQRKLADVRTTGTSDEIAAATRTLEDAQRRVTDATDAQERALLRQRAAARGVTEAEQQLTEAQQAGTKRDEGIKTATDDLTTATEKLKDARKQAAKDAKAADQAVADARVESVRRQREAGKQLAQAEKDQSKTIKDARQSVNDAEQRVVDTRLKSVESQQQAGQRLADTEKAQAKTIIDSRETVASAHEAAAKRIQSAKDAIAKDSQKGPASWLTSDVLTSTLSQFTGEMTDAQLKAKGFSDEQIKSIQKQAKTAEDAATKVKTLSQAFDVAKETAQSGMSALFMILFGDFEQAKKTFTALSNGINGIINTSANARNKVLKDFADLGGRTAIIEGIKNIFAALASVIKPIRDAFHQVFPPKTAEDLFKMASGFQKFTESLKIGAETADNLRRTFAGVFAVFSIFKSILSGVFSAVKIVFKEIAGGSGGFLNFTGGIGDLLVKLDAAIKKSQGFKNFFKGLGEVLVLPIRLIKALVGAIANLFTGFDGATGDKAAKSLDGLTTSLSPLQKILNTLNRGWDRFVGLLDAVMGRVSPAFDSVIARFAGFGTAIKDAFASANYDDVFRIIQTTLIGGIFLTIKKALGGGLNFHLFEGIGAGVTSQIKGVLGTLTGSLKSMQTALKATTLLEISAALVLLAGATKLLSTIDAGSLTKSMTAITTGLGLLVGSLALLSGVGGRGAFLTLPIMATGLIAMAVAIDVLSVAIIALSKLSWVEIAKGLAGVGGALVAVAAGISIMPKSVFFIGPALIPVAIALNILALAVKQFGAMKWEELGKGLLGLGGALTALGLGVMFLPTARLITIGPGLILIGVGLNILALAVKQFGNLKLDQMLTGIAGLGLTLVVLGTAVSAFPLTLALQAAGLVVLAVALNGIAVAVALMGGMKLSSIAKGLIGLGGALAILAVGLTAMSGTALGAASLLLAATGLAILAPTLGILGTMKWETIAKGLAAIAASMLVMGVGGVLAAPGLIAVGAALLVLGLGITAAGAGVYLLAKGLVLLGSEGSKGLGVMVAALTAFVALLPKIVIDFVKGLVDIAQSVAEVAPQVVAAFAKIINSLLDMIITVNPKIREAMLAILGTIITVIMEKTEPLIAAGLHILLSLLSGIANNLGKVTELVGRIVVTFLTKLTVDLPLIVAAGVNMFVKFLNGLTIGTPRMVTAAATMITTFLGSLTAQMPKLIVAGATLVASFITGLSNNVGKVISAGGNLIVAIITGIGKQGEKIAKAGVDVMGDFLQACADAMIKLTNRIAHIIVSFLHALEQSIRDNNPRIQSAGWGVADAIIDGLVTGIKNLGYKVFNAMGDVANHLPKLVRKILGIESPSKVFAEIGGYTMAGMAQGIDNRAPAVLRAAGNAANGAIEAMAKPFLSAPNLLDGIMDVNPVITPVIDLSQVEAGAKQLGVLTNVTPITAAASYGQASAISSDREAAAQAAADAPTVPSVTEFKLEQNNYSPEALPAAEIYRQTKNQFSLAKDALGLPKAS